MTRLQFAAAFRDLPEDEKLDLFAELWDSIDHSGPVPEWHKEVLQGRLDADTSAFVTWTDAKARILASR